MFPVFLTESIPWYCFDKLDVTAMKKAAALLVGEHDFKAFCSNKRTNKSTVREIYDIDIYADTRELQITVYGNGFLYNMVRIIVGTLIEVGKGERRPEEMTAILESRDRTKAGATAAAQGLFLQEVDTRRSLRTVSRISKNIKRAPVHGRHHSRCTVTGSGT